MGATRLGVAGLLAAATALACVCAPPRPLCLSTVSRPGPTKDPIHQDPAWFVGKVVSTYPANESEFSRILLDFRERHPEFLLRPLSLYLTPEGQKRFLIELAGDRISQEALQSIIAGELDRSRFLRSVSYALTRIEVTEDFSGGRVGTTVDMIGGLGPADCSVHFEQGVSYLFAAYKQGGFWTTSKCSGTDESLHAQSTIAALRELRDNRRPPGTIFGSIDPHTLAVRLVGPGGARELAPSHNGRYVFDKLESGDYQLEPSAPGWTFDIAPWTLPIHVNAGCMEVDIRATRR